MTTATSHLAFLAGGGELGARMRAIDGERTSLGAPDDWPQALRTLVALILASNQPMYIAWGPRRAFLYNDHYAPFLGTKHPDALGRDLLTEVWPEIREQLEPLVEATRSGDPVHIPRMALTLHRNGYPEDTHFSFFFAPVRDDTGEVAGLFGACSDITAQVETERELQARHALYHDVVANMGEAFLLFDHEMRVLEANAEAERLTGYAREAMAGNSHWDLFPGTYDSPIGRLYRRVLADGTPGHLENDYTFPDGRRVWFDVRVHAVQEGLAVFFTDVTRRRGDAAAAALTAERVQLALDAGAIIGTWVWTIGDDRFVADRRFAESFGLDPEACRAGLSLETPLASIHPDDRERVEAAVAEALARGGPYRCEYRVRQHDGRYRWIEANGRVECDAHGNAVRFPGVLIGLDERRRIEAERDRAHALLRSFIESVPGVVYAKDITGRLIMGNRGVADLLGVPQEAYLGRTDVELLADKAQAEAVMANDRRIMMSGRAEQLEETIYFADGTPATWLSTKAPMRDANGQVVGLIGTSLDITDRRRMIERLEESDRRKDEFLAMLAHELRNPLAPIGTAAELLRLAPDNPARVQAAAQVIHRQVAHMTSIVDDLLDVSRVTRGLVAFEREPVDLRAVLAAAVEQTEPLLRARRHTLVLESGDVPAVVVGDRHRLVQVVANLLNNAVKYTPDGGRVEVGLVASGEEVVLRVRDSGVGMDARLLPRVFDLFAQGERSPDRSQGGLGIGLALVRSIVQAHGGRVTAASAGPGAGSTFEVTLPRAHGIAEAPMREPMPATPSAPRRTVLVVDDNRDAANTLVAALELFGHDVTVAAGGREALAVAARRADWDAFILDIGMPDMTGHELAGHLRTLLGDRRAHFIALSGYGKPSDQALSWAAGFDHHLVKPADTARIQALLAREPGDVG